MLNCKLRSNKSQTARWHRRRHIIFFLLPPTPNGIYENGSCTPMHFLQSIMTNLQPPRVCWITFFINQFTLVEILLYVHLYSTGNWICHINAREFLTENTFCFVDSVDFSNFTLWYFFTLKYSLVSLVENVNLCILKLMLLQKSWLYTFFQIWHMYWYLETVIVTGLFKLGKIWTI